MSGYNKLATDESEIEMETVTAMSLSEAASASSSAASAPAAPSAPPASAAAAPRAVAPPSDGVFANIAPKVDTPPKYANDPLPTYGDAVVDAAPLQGYTGAVVLTPTSALQDVQVDGLAVGTVGTFFVTLFISWFFGLIGFLCSFMLSGSHAGRSGARAGIGLQFMYWGIFMRSSFLTAIPMPDDDAASAGPSSDASASGESDHGEHYDNDDLPPMLTWVSYLLIVLGWLLFVHGCSVFYHVRRIVRARQLTILAA